MKIFFLLRIEEFNEIKEKIEIRPKNMKRHGNKMTAAKILRHFLSVSTAVICSILLCGSVVGGNMLIINILESLFCAVYRIV